MVYDKTVSYILVGLFGMVSVTKIVMVLFLSSKVTLFPILVVFLTVAEVKQKN